MVASIMALVIAEVATSLWWLAQTGGVSRAELINQREMARDERNPAGDTKQRWENKIKLHPLFGYTYNPKLPSANNFGFLCQYDFAAGEHGYRLKGLDSERPMVVGVFGGSFAQECGQEHRYLEEKLAAEFPGRTPVILNFGIGGHALPQSLFIFEYFRDMVDVAVFIDGLNEVWNAVENNRAGFPPEFAKAAHFEYKLSLGELTPYRFEQTAAIVSAKSKLLSLTDFSLWPGLRQSLLLHFFLWEPLSSHWLHEIDSRSVAIKESYEHGARFFNESDDEIISLAAERWVSHHRVVQRLSEAAGILDLHILQPNPSVPNSKPLTPDERDAVARNPALPEYVHLGYPKLRAGLEVLAQEGALAVDFSFIFASCKDTLWRDPCHLVPVGYRLVLDRVAAIIGREFQETARARQGSAVEGR